MTFTRAAEKAIDAVSEPSKRSRQRTAGVSDLVNPCDRCLTEVLLGLKQQEERVALAPLLGTAFHALAEQSIRTVWCGDNLGLRAEVPLTVGTVGDIEIRGTADLVDFYEGEVLDWKVVSKKKIKAFRTAYVENRDGTFFDDNQTGSNLMRYFMQLQMYAHAVTESDFLEEKRPTHIDTVSLLLVPRDATTETTQDIEQITFRYDPEVYDSVMDRAEDLLAHEGPLDTVPSGTYCFACNNRTRLF